MSSSRASAPSRVSRSPRRLAALTLAALAAGAGAAVAQEGATTVEVRELTLPVRDLEIPTASLDESIRRVDRRRDVELTLSTDVLFAFESARLPGRASSRIASVARDIERSDAPVVTIEGHTDSKGSNAFNLGLSRRRAAAVREALDRALGAEAPRLVASGKGESQPVAPNTKPDGSDNPKGRALNRRVEIRIPKR